MAGRISEIRLLANAVLLQAIVVFCDVVAWRTIVAKKGR
jgi:hypothetical protein